MEQIDKTEDVLSSLKLASQLEDKQNIVISVVDSILTAFSNLPSIEIDNYHKAMVDREEFIKNLNYFITELKNSKS